MRGEKCRRQPPIRIVELADQTNRRRPGCRGSPVASKHESCFRSCAPVGPIAVDLTLMGEDSPCETELWASSAIC
jgi:hypothetical protein